MERTVASDGEEADLSDLIHKMGSALVDDVKHLPPDLRWILFEDLAAAFVNRRRVFEIASASRSHT